MLPAQYSNVFLKSCAFANLANTMILSRSVRSGVSFFSAQGLGERLMSSNFGNKLTTLPTSLASRAASNDEALFEKICPLAPVAGMAVATLAAYKLYAMTSSMIIQGFVLGVHCAATRFFCRSNAFGAVPLMNPIERFLDATGLVGPLPGEVSAEVQAKAEEWAGTALFITSVALTVFSGNPVLANAVAYPVAAVTEAVARRKLRLPQNRGRAEMRFVPAEDDILERFPGRALRLGGEGGVPGDIFRL